MRIKMGGWLFVLVLAMMIGAPMSWAKKTAYNYIVAYSYRNKVVYHSKIFTLSVEGKSSNNEEYVNDTATILKMESAFQKHLEKKLRISSPDLTVSARMAYKTEDIAKRRMDVEVGDFRYKGFEIKEAVGFVFSAD